MHARRSVLFALTLTIVLGTVACGNRNESGQTKNKPDSPASLAADNKERQDINSAADTAPPPIISRSAVPRGWYAKEEDTTQVSQWIRSIFQDRNGDIWFGTVTDGVCRYDGKSLVYYSTAEGFGGRGVQDIAGDAEGRLWFGTSGGVSVFDGNTFTNFTEKEGLSDKLVMSLLIGRDGTVWAGTGKGLCRYNGKKFELVPIPGASENSGITRIVEDDNGNTWFSTTRDGVFRYDGSTFTPVTAKDGLSHAHITWMFRDRYNVLWLVPQKGLLKRFTYAASPAGGYRQLPDFSENDSPCCMNGWRIFGDKAGNVWISSRSALCRYDGHSFTTFGAKEGLTNTGVQSFLEDRAGNAWFGSSAGLFRFDGKSFINVTQQGPWPSRYR